MQAIEVTQSEWVEIGLLADIPRQGARVVRTAQGEIAVFRNADDEVFALLNKCPHRGGPLSEGIVYGRTVACPLHNWCIGLNNGEAVAPDEGCTPSYPVRLEGEKILLSLTPEKAD